MKVAVVGGGSVYTPELVAGLIEARAAGTLPIDSVVLMDIDGGRQEEVAGFCRRLLRENGESRPSRLSLRTTENLSEAIEGASFVLAQFRVGGTAARHEDILLGHRHGLIGQETTGVGGFAKALRTVPRMLEVARTVLERAPDAWLLGFTNPVSIVTQALANRHPQLKFAGLCNYPYNAKKQIQGLLGLDDPDRLILGYKGLNHLSVIDRVRVAAAVDNENPWEDRTAEVLQAIQTEGKGRKLMANQPDQEFSSLLQDSLPLVLNPYWIYFLNTSAVLARERAKSKTRAEEVEVVDRRLFELYRNPDVVALPDELRQRGGAHYSTAAVGLMKSLVEPSPRFPRDLHVVNVLNRGTLPDLDDDDSIEALCEVSAQGIRPRPVGPLPSPLRGIVQAVKNYERFAARAAVEGSYRDAFFALLSHPLTGAGDSLLAERLLDDLLAVNRGYLTGFDKL